MASSWLGWVAGELDGCRMQSLAGQVGRAAEVGPSLAAGDGAVGAPVAAAARPTLAPRGEAACAGSKGERIGLFKPGEPGRAADCNWHRAAVPREQIVFYLWGRARHVLPLIKRMLGTFAAERTPRRPNGHAGRYFAKVGSERF